MIKREQIKNYDLANRRDPTWDINRGDMIKQYSRTRSALIQLETGRWIVLKKKKVHVNSGKDKVYYVCLCISANPCTPTLAINPHKVGSTYNLPATFFNQDFWEKVVETGLSWKESKCT